MRFHRSVKIRSYCGLLFVVALSVSAQRYRDETDASYQRRQVDEANRANQRDLNNAGGASLNSSGSDALLRQYQNQWQNQLEREKAQRESAAQAIEASRLRVKEMELERAGLAIARRARIEYRIKEAMNSAMYHADDTDEGGQNITRLTFFSLWFPQQAKQLDAWKFLGQYGPGNQYEVAQAALERAFAQGDQSAAWLAASLDGDMAWGGPPGLTWWLLYKANEHAPISKDPMEGTRDGDWMWRGTISWVDAQLAEQPGGLVRNLNFQAPDCNYASVAAVEKIGSDGPLAHLALAAAAHGGYLPLWDYDGWRRTARVPGLLEQLRASHPGWGHLLTGLWYQDLRGPLNPAAIAELRQAEAAGGRPAHFARIALAPLATFEAKIPDITTDLQRWQRDSRHMRDNYPANLQRLAAYLISGASLEGVAPAIAKLPTAEREQAAWDLALRALSDAIESGYYVYRDQARYTEFATLYFLHRVATNRTDLWPNRLVERYPEAVPSEVIEQALPAEAAKIYELLLRHPYGGPYAQVSPSANHFTVVAIATALQPYREKYPELKIVTPGELLPKADTDKAKLVSEILQLQSLGLPVPGPWYQSRPDQLFDTLTLYRTKRMLTEPTYHSIRGDPEVNILTTVSHWLATLNTFNDEDLSRLETALRDTPVVFAENDYMRTNGMFFGKDLLALANGKPVQAVIPWPVDQFTPAVVARAAHLINASLGQFNAKSAALPESHPSIAWVRAAGATNDPLALWVMGNRLASQQATEASDYLRRAAFAGHALAFEQVYAKENLLAHPALQQELVTLFKAGRTNLAPLLISLAEVVCEKELPSGYDPDTDKPLPQGDVLKVIAALDRLTAAKLSCPVVVERLLQPLPTSRTSDNLEKLLNESDVVWIKDRKLRAQAFAAAAKHVQQTMFYPGIANVDLVRRALDFFPQMQLARGGDTLYPEAEVTLTEIVSRWPVVRTMGWSNQISSCWHVLAVQNRERKALAASLRCYQRAVTLTDDITVWQGYFEIAMANRSVADIKTSAPRQLARSNAELLDASITLFTDLAEALAGPYGLPADEARLKEMSTILVETTGGVPDVLAKYAPPVKIPATGSPEWEKAILSQVSRFSLGLQPEHAVKFSWELTRTALELPSDRKAEVLMAPYQMLHRLAENYDHVEAKAALARLEKAGTTEQRARNTCADWWAVEPFTAADQLVEKLKAGEKWATRALELWICWGKLPKNAVAENYLKELPQLRTTAVTQWLNAN
ncbi:MAG: hypothetical protein QM813_26675 [Verrucomicrobiota bacterium]